MRTLQMKRALPAIMLVVTSMLVLRGVTPGEAETVPPMHAQPPCTDASLRGSYGYSFDGTVMGIGPTAGSGVITFDGEGNLSGADTLSLNGTIIPRTLTGTYTVQANCTGSVTLEVSTGDIFHLAFVIVDSRRELRFIQTDAGTVITGAAIRSP
jgi:hypothetical protein